MVLDGTLCRPAGAVFGCCLLVSGCVAPLGLDGMCVQMITEQYDSEKSPHFHTQIRRPADHTCTQVI